jgi:transcriptional regulator with XRE-family HTH domain
MKQSVRIYGAERVLRAIRDECDLSSLRQVAKTIGVSPAYLSDILLGKRGVSESIAKTFGFTREDVVSITYRPMRDGTG